MQPQRVGPSAELAPQVSKVKFGAACEAHERWTMRTDRALQYAVRTIRSCARGQYSLRKPPIPFLTSTLQHSIATHRQQRQAIQCRPFTTTKCLLKKGGKAVREEKQAAGKSEATDDPSDFATLEADIAAIIERVKNDLSKLRAGGRFNPEVLENLRLQPNKNNPQTVKLSDLAQVIPKGRTVQVMVGEKDHIKPITSAIQSNNGLNLNPQPDPTGVNPLLLVLNIPPPTAESRKAVVNEASKAGDKAGTSVKDARAKQQKKLNAMKSSKSARPDDLKKAGDRMEKIVEKGMGEVKRVVDGAKKVLEGG